jgi:phage portal protein BeeE
MNIPSFPELKGRAIAWATGKGWRQDWAAGKDMGTGGSDRPSLNEAAEVSTWVFRCLQFIAGPVRSMPLKWYQQTSTGKVEVQDTELAQFWQQPAETANGLLRFGDFTELSLDWINIKGQAMWIMDDSWLMRGGKKNPILLAREDRLSPIKRGDTVVGWLFQDGNGRSATLLPQQVIRPRFLNPFDDAKGMSPLKAGKLAVDADHAAATFALAVAESNGDQGVYVIAKNATLSAEQQAQIIAQLRQKAAQSRAGNFRPAFLTGDVTIEDPKVKSVDSTFIAARAASQAEIFVAFGVPPSMAQASPSYSVGAASDWYRLIVDTCMSHSARLCDAMERAEFMRTGRMLVCEQDFSSHPVMTQARLERVKTGAELWRTGISWQVVNQALDLGLPAFPGHDVSYIPFSLQRVGEDGAETPPALPAPEDKTSALHELRSLFEQRSKAAATPEHHECNEGCSHLSKSPSLHVSKSSAKRRKLWELRMTERAPVEKIFKKILTKALFEARKDTLAKIEATEKQIAGSRQRGILDLLFDLGTFTMQLVEGMKAAHQFTLNLALEQIAAELDKNDPWSMPPERTLMHLRDRENKIRDASRSIHDDIKATLEAGLTKGETSKELSDRVRAAFNGIDKERADSIAITEVGAAYGIARHDSLAAFGIEKREWLSAQDDRVRETHSRIDGATAAEGEAFEVPLKDGGSEPMMFPGDPAASAENVIRCRCVEIAALDEE